MYFATVAMILHSDSPLLPTYLQQNTLEYSHHIVVQNTKKICANRGKLNIAAKAKRFFKKYIFLIEIPEKDAK